MKHSLLTTLVIIFLTADSHAQKNETSQIQNTNEPTWVASEKKLPATEKHTIKWSKDPFDHQIFIENKGQFNTDIPSTDKVLYQAILGEVKAYFTPSGIVYRYNEYPKNTEKENSKPDADEMHIKPIVHYERCTWVGSNPNVTISTEDEQTCYYIYPKDANSSINVNIFKKIIYRNIYPGIDLEYSFIKGKPGMKYSLIVHPGADISLIKLQYSNSHNIQLNLNGDAVLETNVGEFTDHAPLCFYKTNGQKVGSCYKILNGNEETFSVNSIVNKNDDLIIDPWTTNPKFTSPSNKAFDVDYDNAGNVYTYGSLNPFQLTKFNAAGVQQWTFNATQLAPLYYGDFAVDKVTGTSYIVEGCYNKGPGAMALKINTLGTLISTYPGINNMLEMWRVSYNSCTRQIVIGGGGTNSGNYQAAILDTSMIAIKPYNPLNSTTTDHDIASIAIDPDGGTAWMAVARVYGNTSTGTSSYNNVLMSLPVANLSPANYIVPDGLQLEEVTSNTYVDGSYQSANGINGMAASTNWLYSYDGYTLNKVNKGTGSTIASKSINTTVSNSDGSVNVRWGGLDADVSDNIYAGSVNSIQIYSSALNLLSSIPLLDTVFDVVLGSDNTVLYACGKGYVSSITISPASNISIKNSITQTTCSKCIGSATPTLFINGTIPTVTPTYVWSNGQTTQTATNLCSGVYTATITLNCSQKFIDTVIINPTTAISVTGKVPAICIGDSIGLSASGPGAGATYLWSTGQTTDSIIVSPTVTTTYSVTSTDSAGCASSPGIVIITVNHTPTVSVTSSATTICSGNSNVLSATGAIGYTWSPASGLSSSSGASVTATPGIGTITYTVTGNSPGCADTSSKTITITVNVTPTLSANQLTICSGDSTTLTANGATGYTWSPSTGLNTTTGNIVKASPGVGLISYTVTVPNSGCYDTISIEVNTTPSVSSSASPTVICYGNSTTLKANGATNYTWSPSTGLNTTTGASVVATPGLGTTTYTVTGTSLGCSGSSSQSLSILVNSPPIVTVSGASSFYCKGTDILTANASGAPPFKYNWGNGDSYDTANVSSSSIYSVTVTDSNGCSATASFNVGNDVTPTGLNICMVSVDTTSTKNLIEWNKPAQGAIDSFRIYREISSSYKLIASLPYSAYSVYTDATNGVNPNITSYQYEISVIDTCGNESVLSSFHKTIHVAISPAAPCGYNLMWNDYIGFTINQYLIYRDSANTGWKLIDSVSYGNTSWTDISCYPANDTIGYMIEAINPNPCTPTARTQALSTISTLSNAPHNIGVTGIKQVTDYTNTIIVYPNPSNGLFELKTADNQLKISSLDVFNVLGEKIYSELSTTHLPITINISNQSAGVYFIKVITNNSVQLVKLVKE